MDNKECAELLRIIDRLIDISEPQRAEYLRGYCQGIRVHVLGVSDERIKEHRMLMNRSGSGNGDPYVDWYARGYRHGFEGKKTEGPSLSSCPLFIASNG